MITLSNGLSFIRAPLALLFLQENYQLRLTAIFLAMLTDSIDGYLARKYSAASRFGAFFDPAMDKFFVYFALGVFFMEGRIVPWEAIAMVSRDFFLITFGFYLLFSGKWQYYHIKAIRWGKITTALQFIVLMGITLGVNFSALIFVIFVLLGILAFFELIYTRPTASIN